MNTVKFLYTGDPVVKEELEAKGATYVHTRSSGKDYDIYVLMANADDLQINFESNDKYIVSDTLTF